MSAISMAKRKRERDRQDRQRAKAEKRKERKLQKASDVGPNTTGEDPDIAGIVPGPQPRLFDEGDET